MHVVGVELRTNKCIYEKNCTWFLAIDSHLGDAGL